MGIHITLTNSNCEDHPDWDHLRQANDYNFYNLISTIEDINYEEPFRITRFDKIREK